MNWKERKQQLRERSKQLKQESYERDIKKKLCKRIDKFLEVVKCII